MAADWSQLPKELLHLISEFLNSPFYLLRFRSVCSTWRSSSCSFSNYHHRFPLKFPLLNDSNNDASIFSLTKRTLFLITPQQQTLLLRPWLIKIGEDSRGRTQLWHPLSRDPSFPIHSPHVLDFNNLHVFDLGHEFVLGDFPPRSPNNSLYMEKVVIATWQGKEDFVLLTIHVSGKLALFRCGEKHWTVIPDMPTPYDDVCIFKGQPCAVDGTGRAVTVGPDTSLSLLAEPVFGGDKKFLVESKGELLLVDKYLSSDCFCSLSLFDNDNDNDDDDDDVDEIYRFGWERAVRFDVFRLDEKEKRWVELMSLGDRVLFLGDDCAFLASASDLCVDKGNCVIFRDDGFSFNTLEGGMGVFHLDEGRISRLSDCPGYSRLFWPPPDWIMLH